MERAEHILIELVMKEDAKLRRLYKEHEELESELLELQRRAFLTDNERLLVRDIKYRKLRGKEQIMRIIDEHRKRIDLNRARVNGVQSHVSSVDSLESAMGVPP
jgi:hypothetical protein